ncbi:hypothetical protein F4677DRAFT_440450 [Hypoxylon crocopeplum]|nr:hypothetical protein F4677DRAFT_440450 [Hypoxylon crocopeplum]
MSHLGDTENEGFAHAITLQHDDMGGINAATTGGNHNGEPSNEHMLMHSHTENTAVTAATDATAATAVTAAINRCGHEGCNNPDMHSHMQDLFLPPTNGGYSAYSGQEGSDERLAMHLRTLELQELYAAATDGGHHDRESSGEHMGMHSHTEEPNTTAADATTATATAITNGCGHEGCGKQDPHFHMYTVPPTMASNRGGLATAPQTRICQCCRDEKDANELSQGQCLHEYCGECITRHFQLAMTKDSMYPARCCGLPIPLLRVQHHLTPELGFQYREKGEELLTSNRTYCHRTTCFAFVPSAMHAGRNALCMKCLARTCTDCKRASHDGVCASDEALQAVLQLAEREGWQRCYRCKTMVEFIDGCYHMTCICGAAFCYLCGLPWKTCNCPPTEARLILFFNADAAENRARHDRARANLDAAIARMRTLFGNPTPHVCPHLQWTNRPGSFECAGCTDRLPYFIYQCDQCQLMACRRCRFEFFELQRS